MPKPPFTLSAMRLLIADAHIQNGTPQAAEFLQMLEAISQTPHDVVFLGDIIDLWIAIPRYENHQFEDFIQWCRREKERRRLSFLEGNHEFFIARRHAALFGACAVDRLREGDCLYLHGDHVLGKQFGHWLLHFLTKSLFGICVLSCLPWGPSIANWARRTFSHGKGATGHFPQKPVKAWAAAELEQGVRHIFLGHFHSYHAWRFSQKRSCTILPAWKAHGEIGLYDEQRGKLTVAPWRRLLP
jgi:UDP-2,3-diacylglucosamine pyrophosphatase LpxH